MIRSANNADTEKITSLVFDVLQDYGLKPDPENTDADLNDIEASYQERGGGFDVLTNDYGEIIGTVGVFPLENGRCELRKMYLHRDERGKGLGRLLVEHALRRSSELGFTLMILETASVLKEAISLYEKCGFRPYKSEHLSERCDQSYIKEIRAEQSPPTNLTAFGG